MSHAARADVVGFNLPFDLGGLAVHFGPALPARGGGTGYYPGWSLSFERHRGIGGNMVDRRWFPRLFMKSIDPRRTLMGFANATETELAEITKGAGGGRFVDLRTLAFALTEPQTWTLRHRRRFNENTTGCESRSRSLSSPSEPRRATGRLRRPVGQCNRAPRDYLGLGSMEAHHRWAHLRWRLGKFAWPASSGCRPTPR